MNTNSNDEKASKELVWRAKLSAHPDGFRRFRTPFKDECYSEAVFSHLPKDFSGDHFSSRDGKPLPEDSAYQDRNRFWLFVLTSACTRKIGDITCSGSQPRGSIGRER